MSKQVYKLSLCSETAVIKTVHMLSENVMGCYDILAKQFNKEDPEFDLFHA